MSLIYGINPYTISSIRMRRFKRHGPHPLWLKAMQKRHPFKAFFGIYSPDFFTGYYLPSVSIYGSDGSLLKEITCRSNDRAKQLHDQLNDELINFVVSTKSLVDTHLESV
jgi:hypothetical protein